MAFYDATKDEDDENNQNAQSQGPQQASAESAVISGGGQASSPQAKPASAPDHPGNFVGIQQYLDANKPQAAKLGDQTAGVIGQSADAARQGVSALNQEAQEKVKAVAAPSADTVTKLQNDAEDLSADERAGLKTAASATYKGPAASTNLTAYQNAADATQKATTNIDNSGTEQGRMNLISQVNSKPRTSGMNTFDNALLQAGGGREKLAQAASANQDVKGGLDAANTAINAQIGRADDPSTPDVDESSGAIGQTNKTKAQTYQQIQDALNSWTTGFQPKVQQAQAGLTDWQNKVTSNIASNPYNLDADVLSATGLNAGDRLYGLNLNDYLNKSLSPSDINAANVASTQDYARYGALADLAGVTNPILNQANIAKAGTANQNAIFDQAKLANDRTSAEEMFKQLAQDTTLTGTGSAQAQRKNAGTDNLTNEDLKANASQSISDYLNRMGPKVSAADDYSKYNYAADINPMLDSAKSSAQSDLVKKITEWLANNHYNTMLNPDQRSGIDNTPQPIKIKV